MPPSFFISPAGFPGPAGMQPAYLYDDVWEEVADRSYAGYGCLGAVQASSTALTPSADADAGQGAAYDYFRPSSSSLSSSSKPKLPSGGFKDDPEDDDEFGGFEAAEGGYKDEKEDWMDKYRKEEEELARREEAEAKSGGGR